MFTLKPKDDKHKRLKEQLRLIETTDYKYLLTTDKTYCEDNKINIVFQESQTSDISKMLDWIVQGEALYVTGYTQFGQKRVRAKEIQYFIVEDEDVVAVLQKERMNIKMKLYEVNEFLKEKPFIRISKYCVVNIAKIRYIKPLMNSKLDLEMMNNDHVEVNRSYYKEFKKILEL